MWWAFVGGNVSNMTPQTLDEAKAWAERRYKWKLIWEWNRNIFLIFVCLFVCIASFRPIPKEIDQGCDHACKVLGYDQGFGMRSFWGMGAPKGCACYSGKEIPLP